MSDDILEIFEDNIKKLGISKELWSTYGERDNDFVKKIINTIKSDCLPQFHEAVEQLKNSGITAIENLFHSDLIEQLQFEYSQMLKTKNSTSHHIAFDGNNGENWLEQNLALSTIASNSTVRNIVESYFGQPTYLVFEKLYTDVSTLGYTERAYHPHHDGYGHVGLKVMILLSDVLPGTLGMRYCCGTHDYIYPTTRSQETQITFDYWNKLYNVDCHGKAGTVYIFNPNGIHSGWKNINADCSRSVLVLNFQPGQFRNYKISPLHKSVLEKFTPYEHIVFRTDDYDKVFCRKCTIDEYIKIINIKRDYAKSVRSLHDSVISKFDIVIDNALLKEMTKINKMELYSTKPEFVCDSPDYSKYSEQMLQLKYFYGVIAKNIKYTYVSIDDLNRLLQGDLDLPVRMYCPISDLLRDNMIIALRDSKLYVDKIKILFHEQVELFNESKYLDFSSFSIGTVIEELRSIKSDDDNLRMFISDLIEMLSRKQHDIGSVYKTLLWSAIIIYIFTELNVNKYFDSIFMYALWNFL